MDTISGSGQSNLRESVTNLVNNVVNQYIVRPTGGKNSSGVSGFVFDIVDNEEIFLDSEITDHYVEDNYAIEDHIALKPERFVLRGYVAEIKDIFPNTVLSLLTNIQSLGSIGGFLPEFAAQATEVYGKIADVASKIGNVFNQAQNIYDMFQNSSTTATKQQKAFKYFRDLWISNTLCDVETPFGILTNMAIENVRALQKGDTKFISDFVITFKKIRVTNTIAYGPSGLTGAAQVSSGRLEDMLSSVQNNGQTNGQAYNDNGDPITPVGNLQGAFSAWQESQFSLL